MVQLTLWSEEVLASLSRSQDRERPWTDQVLSCGSIADVLSLCVRNGYCGKTSQGSLAREMMPTDASFGIYTNAGIVLHGECLMLNSCEYPCGTFTEESSDGSVRSHNAAAVSFLSDILEAGPHLSRYCLSARACRGILNRAERRGKPLPPQLEEALRKAAEQET